MRLALFALAMSAALVPTWASACSMIYRPFKDHLRETGPGTLAIYGRPAIQFDVRTDERWSGTIDFSRIRCLKRPRVLACPKELRVAFDEYSHNCEEVLSGRSVHHARRLRYFMFYRMNGAWKLNLAARKLDR